MLLMGEKSILGVGSLGRHSDTILAGSLYVLMIVHSWKEIRYKYRKIMRIILLHNITFQYKFFRNSNTLLQPFCAGCDGKEEKEDDWGHVSEVNITIIYYNIFFEQLPKERMSGRTPFLLWRKTCSREQRILERKNPVIQTASLVTSKYDCCCIYLHILVHCSSACSDVNDQRFSVGISHVSVFHFSSFPTVSRNFHSFLMIKKQVKKEKVGMKTRPFFQLPLI